MRLPTAFLVPLLFAAAAGTCVLAAGVLSTTLEEATDRGVQQRLSASAMEWARVDSDGLRVVLTGTAPDEAARLRAMSVAGEVVDAARIINEMDVVPRRDISAPRFSAEILRNQSGISLIGLIPAGTDRAQLIERMRRAAGGAPVSDLLETADYAVPEGWDEALDFTVKVLDMLPRAKVSVDAGRVEVTAVADSPEAKVRLVRELKKAAPKSLKVSLSISAPRPAITPFTLRYIIDEDGARFDSCSADTEAGRDRILEAAEAAGGTAGGPCVLGLGTPSPRWSVAAASAIGALKEIGAGSVTFTDADVTLAVPQGTDPAVFDRVIGELDAALPPVFVLHAVLPEPKEKGETGPTEFIATRSPEGLVQLRGRLTDETLQQMADAYAKARFGSASVYSAARVADDLPADWALRVLTGIEALSRLTHGSVVVAPDAITVRGTSSREEAKAEIAGLLSDRLDKTAGFDLDVTYVAPPPPEEETVTPEMSEADSAEVQRTSGKISFDPGSATIAEASRQTMNAISDILKECGDIPLEIQGHTDSQGRDTMNQELSQSRAQSVLAELRSRRILTGSYSARGYGETMPIADNGTEDGREANRRIEFRLIRPEATADESSTLDAVAQEGQEGDTTGSGDDSGSGDDTGKAEDK